MRQRKVYGVRQIRTFRDAATRYLLEHKDQPSIKLTALCLEQLDPFRGLPVHLQTMALFKVNTGCREQEVCKLRWDWEIPVPELGTSVFLIPADFGDRHANSGVKNRDERLVVLNSVAKSIIDKQRGISREWVFPYNGTAMHRMNDSAWKKARVRAAKLWQEENLRPAHPGYASIRIHDLKHTFGRRLRAAGVTEEDRKSLLGRRTREAD